MFCATELKSDLCQFYKTRLKKLLPIPWMPEMTLDFEEVFVPLFLRETEGQHSWISSVHSLFFNYMYFNLRKTKKMF